MLLTVTKSGQCQLDRHPIDHVSNVKQRIGSDEKGEGDGDDVS